MRRAPLSHAACGRRVLRRRRAGRSDDASRSRPRAGEQATMAGEALAGVEFDRVITSGLARTVETARIVAPGREPETWPEFEELRPGRLADIDEDGLEAAFAGAFAGTITRGHPVPRRRDDRRAHEPCRARAPESSSPMRRGTPHSPSSTAASTARSSRTPSRGSWIFFGGFEQAPACINVLDVGDDGRWIVRVVNSAEHLGVTEHQRSTTMEEYYAEFASTRSRKRADELAERGRAPRASARDRLPVARRAPRSACAPASRRPFDTGTTRSSSPWTTSAGTSMRSTSTPTSL